MLYRQCRMIKMNGRSRRSITSYIPDKFAVLNKIIRLHGEDGWMVVEVADHAVEDPKHAPKVIREHRKNTGDSLP